MSIHDKWTDGRVSIYVSVSLRVFHSNLINTRCAPRLPREHEVEKKQNLKQLVLERHVVLRLQSDASTHDVDERAALFGERVDDRGARRGQWGLEHVAEDAEDGVEAFVVGLAVLAPLDAGHEFGDEDEIDDQGRRKEGVFADVEHRDGLVAAEEDLY
nr:hypothetical protein CFP56_01046 [Quercus suber]